MRSEHSLSSPSVGSKRGVSRPQGCPSSDFSALINRTVLLPVFDDVGGNAANGWFHIKGFAASRMSGYNNNTGTASCTGSCKGIIGSCKGIIGRFLRFTSLDSDPTSAMRWCTSPG